MQTQQKAQQAPETGTVALLPGTVIGDHFVVTRRLGGGGMGEVYLAEHNTLPDIKCAVKILHADFSANQGFVDMLRAEARRQSRLRHDNVVQIHDFFPWRGRHCLVQSFVPGESLSQVIEKTPRGMPLTVALGLVGEVLAGLDYAHSQGVVHCDVKPANIIVDAAGRPRITDFGIAHDLTNANNVAGGSPGYMSPEQEYPPYQVDHRTDVYSTGVMLFEMLTARLPFPDDARIPPKERLPPDIRNFRPDVSKQLARIIATALQPDREMRFGGCADFFRAITDHLWWRRWTRVWVPVIAGVCITGVITAFGLQHWRAGVLRQRLAAASEAILTDAHTLNQLCRETRERGPKSAGLELARQSGNPKLVAGFTARLHDIDANIQGFAQTYVDNLEQLRKAGLNPAESTEAGHAATQRASDDPATQLAVGYVTSDYGAVQADRPLPSMAELTQRCGGS